MRSVVLFLALAMLAAGCVAPQAVQPTVAPPGVDFTHLTSPNATKVVDAAGVRTFLFEGTTSQAQYRFPLLGVPVPPGTLGAGGFEVDGSVGFVEMQLNYTAPAEGGVLAAFLRDAQPQGRVQTPIQCGAVGPASRCTVPIPDNRSRETWLFTLGAQGDLVPEGLAYTVSLALHPASHMTFGDPLAGIDPAITFRVGNTGHGASEPLVGVLSDGTLFAQHFIWTMRSKDDGKTWEAVNPPSQPSRVPTFDPMMLVDPWTDTVYVDQLYIACSNLAYSKDAGATWVPSPAACGAPGNDHQKLAAGPGLVPGTSVLYYAYSSFVDGVWVSRSLDGGLVWTTAYVAGGPPDGRSARNTGPVAADRLGNVVVPYYFCDGDGYVAAGVSHDLGQTWKVVTVDEEPADCNGELRPDPDPSIGIDSENNLYFAYHRPSGVKYSVSTDHGDTWSEPRGVSPASLKSYVHVAAVAGDPGKLAIAYRATPDSARGAQGADGWSAWRMYVTFVEDGLSAQPRASTGVVNGTQDLQQRGTICTSGIACVGGNRNLLDFIDADVTPDGRVVVTYADSCGEQCETPAESRFGQGGPVAILEQGPRLFANGAPWAKGAARATLPALPR